MACYAASKACERSRAWRNRVERSRGSANSRCEERGLSDFVQCSRHMSPYNPPYPLSAYTVRTLISCIIAVISTRPCTSARATEVGEQQTSRFTVHIARRLAAKIAPRVKSKRQVNLVRWLTLAIGRAVVGFCLAPPASPGVQIANGV
jgi:hypothetical protein